jgi:hypothetical protein
MGGDKEMSYMEKVAEMFGLKLGERFYIDSYGSIEYELTKDGVALINLAGKKIIVYTILHDILVGEKMIIKKETSK